MSETPSNPQSKTSKSKATIKPAKELIMPLVPLRDIVVFPHTELVLSFGRNKSVVAIEKAFQTSNKLIFLVAQNDPTISDPESNDLYLTGTICRVERLLRTNTDINALVRGVQRAKLLISDFSKNLVLAKVAPIEAIPSQGNNSVITKLLVENLKKAVNFGKPIDFLVFMKLMSGVSTDELVDNIASFLDVSIKEKQSFLEEINLDKRLELVSEALIKELKILELENSITSKTQKKFDKNMKEAILRERMKTIQKELGEEGDVEADPEIKDLKKKIKKIKVDPEVKEKIQKELKRLSNMPSYNPESGYIRNWLDWVLDLPWNVKTSTQVDNKKAEKILNEDHYGLEEVKERILEYLAVMDLREKQGAKLKVDKDAKATTILCFVGPPGVGKTSIGKSIARALGRKFVKISIGGIKDEAEVRGHRRTYVGAMPGRIIKGIKDAKVNNPVFMLDEIDKIGNDYRGDPSAALLEALDPEQNFAFSDHYLEVPYDLSDVLFITTANVLDTIPPALRDRLEVINFSGYTPDEKFNIGYRYLYPKTRKANALLKTQIDITRSTQKLMISDYTKEAGVRDLERQFHKIMRKAARKIDNSEVDKVEVSTKSLHKFLGPIKFIDAIAESKDDVGIATGLAWTQVGGDILFIEVALMPGKGKLQLTGKLGDVMKESCQAALSFIRSHWKQLGVPKDFYDQYDFHIHVPEGAVPKDGPSAGVTIATALYSAITGKKVKKDVGMTGEITLRGRVLAIGGLKEKLIAAHRAGLKTVIIPQSNKKDLVEVPDKVKNGLIIKFSKNVSDNFKAAIIE